MKKEIAKLPVQLRVSDPRQGELELFIDRQIDEDGIGMGVLSDGTPFLNQRGLARLCGVENRYIGLISSGWFDDVPSKDVQGIKAILYEQGLTVDIPAYETFDGRRKVLAYPEAFCTAVLEYFAFEADRMGQPIALRNYRRLTRHGLKQFIYARTGYTALVEDDVWRIFKDRVSLTYDAVPEGYFGIFKELSETIVTLGLKGLHIDQNFVPDISVGQAWAEHWKSHELSLQYGDRRTYAHLYPEYFPQSASNPQLANCYPEDALGEFRRWFRDEYIGEGRFKRYLANKATEWRLPDGYVEKAVLALTRRG
jgi:hypothetical protein